MIQVRGRLLVALAVLVALVGAWLLTVALISLTLLEPVRLLDRILEAGS